MGEVIDRHKFIWKAAPHVIYGHDFTVLVRRSVSSTNGEPDTTLYLQCGP
jgi:hypothetical protein